MKRSSVLLLLIAILVFSCKKHSNNATPAVADSPVYINVQHLWDSTTDFQVGSMLVNPLNGDSLQFSHFKYYLSNIKLQRENGSWWVMPDSYFIVDASTSAGTQLSLGNVPNDKYVAVNYTLGVDSLHNVSGSQTGALDPVNGMFWSWTSGYIMLLTEGSSPDIGTEQFFSLHCTGYKKPYNIVIEKTHSFPETLDLSGAEKRILLSCNPAHLWFTHNIATYNNISGEGSSTQKVTSDFYSTFEFDGIQ